MGNCFRMRKARWKPSLVRAAPCIFFFLQLSPHLVQDKRNLITCTATCSESTRRKHAKTILKTQPTPNSTYSFSWHQSPRQPIEMTRNAPWPPLRRHRLRGDIHWAGGACCRPQWFAAHLESDVTQSICISTRWALALRIWSQCSISGDLDRMSNGVLYGELLRILDLNNSCTYLQAYNWETLCYKMLSWSIEVQHLIQLVQ